MTSPFENDAERFDFLCDACAEHIRSAWTARVPCWPRMQPRIALLRRVPSLALAVPPAAVDFRTETVVFGLHGLPVRW